MSKSRAIFLMQESFSVSKSTFYVNYEGKSNKISYLRSIFLTFWRKKRALSHELRQHHCTFATDIENKNLKNDMKVLFSPEFKGHVFLGLNEENTQLMDVMVCRPRRSSRKSNSLPMSVTCMSIISGCFFMPK